MGNTCAEILISQSNKVKKKVQKSHQILKLISLVLLENEYYIRRLLMFKDVDLVQINS